MSRSSAEQMGQRLVAISDEVMRAPVGERGAVAVRLFTLWRQVEECPVPAEVAARVLHEEETQVMCKPPLDPPPWPDTAANDSPSP